MNIVNNKVLVSIINWNNNEATAACLESIAKIPKSNQPDIRLIDNHSTIEKFDISKNTLSKLKNVVIIKNISNQGFAKAHNESIKHAIDKGYGYACVLNNDTEIVDAKLFDELAAALNDETIASAPTIMDQNNNIWYAGGNYSKTTSTPSHNMSGMVEYTTNHIETNHITGCCMMLNLNLVKKHKLFLPDKYFMYWEDAEWGVKAKKLGLKLVYVPDVQITHTVSSSLGMQSPTYIYYIIRNNILFIKRNTPWIHKPLSYLKVLSIDAKYELKSLGIGWTEFKQTEKTLLRAWIDGLRNRGGKMKNNNV